MKNPSRLVDGSHCRSKRPFLRYLALVVGLLAVFNISGCGSGDGLNRKAVKGKVTVNGTAVPNGSVSFEPLDPGGVGSGAVITSGEYSIAKKDGLPPGKYLVKLTGDDGTNFGVSEGMMPGDEEMPARKQLIPPGWKQEISVEDAGPFEFDFEVTSKRK